LASEVEAVEVIVEVPKGSRNKYARQPNGSMRLDRVLYSSVHYPADYGVVDRTLGEDGEPLDALVLITEPTFVGCHVPARIIDEVLDLGNLESHWLRAIETFFATYKALEPDDVEVVGCGDATAASAVLANTRSAARSTLNEGLP
jgi:inorganic pyrophosphatase